MWGRCRCGALSEASGIPRPGRGKRLAGGRSAGGEVVGMQASVGGGGGLVARFCDLAAVLACHAPMRPTRYM
eukprot:117151-Chlamydomonas_euryale.AAC.4